MLLIVALSSHSLDKMAMPLFSVFCLVSVLLPPVAVQSTVVVRIFVDYSVLVFLQSYVLVFLQSSDLI